MSNSIISEIQKDYSKLIFEYDHLIKGQNLSSKNVAFLIDEIKAFWLKQTDLIRFELESLTKNHDCFILSGAIYLGINDNDHYLFKSLGDHHILFDPFIKMEPFFTISEKMIDTKSTLDYFIKVYNDTYEILKNYSDYFFILPIQELNVENHEEHKDLLNKFFWNFISNIFPSEFTNEEDFCKKYETIDQIENDLDTFILQNLVYTDIDDRSLNLKERILKYFQHQMNFKKISEQKSESQMFILSTYSYISQSIDILLMCLPLNLIPFIRADVTFNYFTLIMSVFSEDEILKKIITKTIVFYILSKSVDRNIIFKIDFREYCARLKKVDLLNNILNEMNESNIDILKGGIKKLEKIILNEFKSITA